MSKNHTEVTVRELPNCDFCTQQGVVKAASYDGKTSMGPWANMCTTHYRQYGTGLGLGKGQKLVKG